MTTIIVLVLIAGVLTLASGCAKPDWIEQTLVTVDVTGSWRNPGGNFELKLEQQGSKVTGSMVWRGQASGLSGTISGAIEGTVSGDLFKFKQTSGTSVALNGEATVSGDEMTGVLNAPGIHGPLLVRRVDSSRPSSQ